MGRRDGPTLAERVQAPEQAEPAGEVARTRPVVRRHCWVQGLPDTPGRWPGLLVEWRQPGPEAGSGTGAARWEGRVLYVVAHGVGAPVVVEAWLPAGHLAPA